MVPVIRSTYIRWAYCEWPIASIKRKSEQTGAGGSGKVPYFKIN